MSRNLSLREIKKARSKISILKAAFELIGETPFREVKVEDICRKAEVSTVTFFKFFLQKEDLLIYFMRLWLTDRLIELKLEPGRGIGAIRRLFQTAAAGAGRRPGLMLSLIGYLSEVNMHPDMPALSEAEIRILYPGKEALVDAEAPDLGETVWPVHRGSEGRRGHPGPCSDGGPGEGPVHHLLRGIPDRPYVRFPGIYGVLRSAFEAVDFVMEIERRRRSEMRRTWMGIAFALALLVAAYAVVQFLVLDPKTAGMVRLHLLDAAFPYKQWVNFLYLHAAGGAVSLAVGIVLFSRRLQAKHPRLHRRLGKMYVVSIAVGGGSGIYLSFEALGGLASQAGFLALDILWLVTTYFGYKRIREKKIGQHREWMMRSYALTFAGVTLRFWVAFLGILTIPLENFSQFELLLDDFNRMYRLDAWLCWVPNLLVAEWLIRRGRRNRGKELVPLAA